MCDCTSALASSRQQGSAAPPQATSPASPQYPPIYLPCPAPGIQYLPPSVSPCPVPCIPYPLSSTTPCPALPHAAPPSDKPRPSLPSACRTTIPQPTCMPMCTTSTRPRASRWCCSAGAPQTFMGSRQLGSACSGAWKRQAPYRWRHSFMAGWSVVAGCAVGEVAELGLPGRHARVGQAIRGCKSLAPPALHACRGWVCQGASRLGNIHRYKRGSTPGLHRKEFRGSHEGTCCRGGLVDCYPAHPAMLVGCSFSLLLRL